MTTERASEWQEKINSHWKLLDFLARQRFSDTNMAHESLLFVVEKLEEDDWRRIRAYEGKAKLETYLSLIVTRLLDDFARHKLGRLRPPTWIEANGPLYKQVYQLLCVERMSLTDAVETLADSVPGGRERSVIEDAAMEILSRIVDCGSYRGETVVADMEELDSGTPSHPSLHNLSPEDLLMARERASILEHLGCFLSSGESDRTSGASDSERITVLMQRISAQSEMKEEDRLFLRAIYQDGWSVSAAGRLLGWSNNQAHGKLRRLLARLHSAIAATGLEQELRQILEDG